MIRSALAYASRCEWPVFPLRPRSKAPLISERDGGNGFHDATTEPEQIRQWWSRCPDANIGIACDARSGLLVLDIDPRNGGDEELAALEAEHGQLPHTIEALTGGGGRHLYFRRPAEVSFRGKLCTGVDVKAAGYVLAPPSVHENGRSYVWEASSRPLETELADLPAWVLARILKYEPEGFYAVSGDCEGSFLARAFAAAGWLGSRIDATRVNCLCPWEAEHTVKSGSGGSVLFAAREGSGAGKFYCAHTSHGPKTLRDVLAVLPIEAVRTAAAEAAQDAADDAEERAAIQAEAGAA
jgi:hypothetical protein